MKNKKYVFAGNRSFVYQKMKALNLNIVQVYAIPNSYFHRYLDEHHYSYQLIQNKKKFIQEIAYQNFDIFIANGLPIILPISQLSKNEKKFINIHPSLLPDLRGRDPVLGALLYQRQSGATCHYMDDGIDTGDIISQIPIDYSNDLDAGLLYQLTFIAEADVFEKAYIKNFQSIGHTCITDEMIYYSFHESDRKIDLKDDSIQTIIGKVRAFATKSKGAFFELEGKKIKCYGIELIENKYFQSLSKRYNDLSIIFQYEDCIIIKKNETLLKFKNIMEI